MASVWANLVVGSNGTTTFNRNSRALSSHLDRKRFHEIRKQAELILIGGQTARIEPYSKTPVPLVVVTRTPGNIGSAAKNPIHRTMNSSPIEAVATLIEAGYKSILIEGGVNFLRELIRQQVLDGLYVTHANAEGSEDHFDLELLTSDYAVQSIEDSDGESFFTYKRINH